MPARSRSVLLPVLPVIMYSTLTQRGAEATLDALSKGATDYVTKPSNVGNAAQGLECIRTQLIPRIKGICSRVLGVANLFYSAPSRALQDDPPEFGRSAPRRANRHRCHRRLDGGAKCPCRSHAIFSTRFPRAGGHRPAHAAGVYSSPGGAPGGKVTDRRGRGPPRRVLRPGCAWIAPGDYHMIVATENRRVTLRTYKGPPENSCRPAVDVLFRSVADIYKPHTLAVEMTGMGQDGLRGCELIREFGGQILAQDQASSVVWGMPGFVANAGLADKVLPLDQLGMEIIRRVRYGREAIREFKSALRTVESSNPK